MPLARGPSGKLGIDASGLGGGGAVVNVIDQRKAGADIEVREVEQDGRQVIELIVQDQVNAMFRTGAIDGALGNFGAKRQGVRR